MSAYWSSASAENKDGRNKINLEIGFQSTMPFPVLQTNKLIHSHQDRSRQRSQERARIQGTSKDPVSLQSGKYRHDEPVR